MAWQSWFWVGGPVPNANTPVSVVARDPDHLDLFITGFDGLIYTVYWDSASGWATWFPVPGALTNITTAIKAVTRDLDRMDLFVTGPDGLVYWTYWEGSWSGAWSAVGGSFPGAASSIEAVARDADHMDLFVSGTDREVYQLTWDAAVGWSQDWVAVAPGFGQAGAAVTAIARDAEHLDLFVVASNGAVYANDWNTTDGWTGPWLGLGNVQVVSAVAAVARNPDHIDIFATGSDGIVYSTWWDITSPWAAWFPLSGLVANNSYVSAVARDPDHLDVFAGATNTISWSSAGGWGQWVQLASGLADPGSYITPIARHADHIDLFLPTSGFQDGRIYSNWWDPQPGTLHRAAITFNTHGENKDQSTVVHVFLKTRRNDSLSPQEASDFISNLVAYRRYQQFGNINGGGPGPYLASGIDIADGMAFGDPSQHTFELPLASYTITADDVILPEVNVHMLAHGDDTWAFDYSVTLEFDGASWTFSSNADGVNGIVLNQDNRNHTGVGLENPLRTQPIPVAPKAATDATLKRIILEFAAHDDDNDNNKDVDTRLNVRIVNRLGPDQVQDLAVGLDLFHDQEFPASGPRDDLYRRFEWTSVDNTLASDDIRLADMVLPMVYIVIAPNGSDTWAFDYQVTFEFEDEGDFGDKRQAYTSRTNGVILNQDFTKHAGVYQGRPFPTAPPPTAPNLVYQPIDRTGASAKIIPVSLLTRKFDEFINNRQEGQSGQDPPLVKIHLGSAGGSAVNRTTPLPESYYDVQSLINGGNGDAVYTSSPSSLGQLKSGFLHWGVGDAFIVTLNSTALRFAIDASRPAAPFKVTVEFFPRGDLWVDALDDVTIDHFVITVFLTLDISTTVNRFGKGVSVVDVMSWIPQIDTIFESRTFVRLENLFYFFHYTGVFLQETIDVVLPESTATSGDNLTSLLVDKVIEVQFHADTVASDTLRATIRDKIFGELKSVDTFTNRTRRDDINGLATRWLLGGSADDPQNTDGNNVMVSNIGIRLADPQNGVPEDAIVIDFAGPREVFAFQPPPDWPSGYDLGPGSLANIDHIVVLTMENRSFDHMLGYLSLPTELGGLGRTDVDGLTADKANSYEGTDYPIFRLGQTRFAPGPPNGYESVHQAINGGLMDGFVKSHAEANGKGVAGMVMGYHTGDTVPVYDAVVRDFAMGHRWFCSHPGPTLPNRFFELTGRPNLDPRGFWEFQNSNPIVPVFTQTIFDYLDGAVDPRTGAPVTWRYFEHAYCTLRFFERYTFDNKNIVGLEDPLNGFFQCAASGTLPSVTYIDPHYVDYPPGSNDDEPPSDIADGQALVQRIVESIVTSPAWERTMLVIVYDEHGGFYDHVPPPEAPRVSEEFPIFTLGLRVPAFVISPWVTAASVFGYDDESGNPSSPTLPREPGQGLSFDHTSILKTIARRFLSDNPPYLGPRYAASNDLSAVLTNTLRTDPFLPFVRYRIDNQGSGTTLGAAAAAPGEPFKLVDARTAACSQMSFEFGEDGLAYLRTNPGRYYLSVKAGGEEPGSNWPVIMDIKHLSPELQGPQRWSVVPDGLDEAGRPLFLISSQAYPDRFLQRTFAAGPTAEVAVSSNRSGSSSHWLVVGPITSV